MWWVRFGDELNSSCILKGTSRVRTSAGCDCCVLDEILRLVLLVFSIAKLEFSERGSIKVR